jgi:NAD(P)H-dependent flavin oxidoreductase YrpB (nitropropane dioxygenase family)
MNLGKMKSLVIGNIKAKLPIIQGGMGVGISLSGLAASVANQGGIGVIATAGIGMSEPDYFTNFKEANIRALKEQIQKAREMSKGIIGANIMVALSDFSDMVKTAIEEKIDIIFSGAGLPLDLPKFLDNSSSTKLIPIVSSGKAARIITQQWIKKYDYIPDAIIVEGPKAGGHLGFKEDQLDDPKFELVNLVQDVITNVKPFEEAKGKKIPVIAAGGIYSGEDIYEVMKAGASGVQMATRFVTTNECDASREFKECYINAQQDDIAIIKSPVGMPGRAIRNSFINSINGGQKTPVKCPYHCIRTCDYKKSPYCIALALSNAKNGKMKNGFAFAGTNAYKAEKITSVKKLISTLKNEYRIFVKKLSATQN